VGGQVEVADTFADHGFHRAQPRGGQAALAGDGRCIAAGPDDQRQQIADVVADHLGRGRRQFPLALRQGARVGGQQLQRLGLRRNDPAEQPHHVSGERAQHTRRQPHRQVPARPAHHVDSRLATLDDQAVARAQGQVDAGAAHQQRAAQIDHQQHVVVLRQGDLAGVVVHRGADRADANLQRRHRAQGGLGPVRRLADRVD
jgi:hypothetical protein